MAVGNVRLAGPPAPADVQDMADLDVLKLTERRLSTMGCFALLTQSKCLHHHSKHHILT